MTTDRGYGPPGDRGYALPPDRGYAPTGDRGFGPPPDRRQRFVHCARCHVLQPLGSAAPSRCVACGAPIQRWVAHPPPGGPTPKNLSSAKSRRPYVGPPSYRGGHPHWSFPPVVWRDLPAPQPTPAPGDPTGGLRWATWLSVATAATALLAAGAEIWRFTLMLQGRKLVLSGDVVRASDVLVAASGLAVVLAALLTVAAAVPALLQTHVVAAARLGRTPARTGRAIAARLLVPFWNVYGAGQIVMEIDGMLSASAAGDSTVTGRPRASRLTSVWWLSWVVSSLLMAATLARAFGGSLQAIADTVELHIALDLTAAVVAGLGAAMLHRFTRLLSGPKKAFSGWVVQPPEPTRPLPQPARSVPEPTEPTRPLPELARPLPEPTGKVPEPTGKVPEPAPAGALRRTGLSGERLPAGYAVTVGYRDWVSKKNQRRSAGSATALADHPSATDSAAEFNPRRPCPCGSGKRFKACHGSPDAADMIVIRPFAGLAAETELIALREFVPAASAPLTLIDPLPDVPSVTLASVLPGAAAALTRADGSVLVGMQVQTHSGDLSRDLAAALEWALSAEPSSVLPVVGRASVGARYGDLIRDEPIDVTVHSDFSWWLEETPEPGGEVALSLERANAAIMPTARVAGLTAAYWVDAGDRAHLRWVRPEDEQPLMAALARLAVSEQLDLGEGSRYVGSFRAHGRLVPVWDLDRDAHPSEWDAPALAFADRLGAALAVDAPLTDAERRARDGILGRQFTLR